MKHIIPEFKTLPPKMRGYLKKFKWIKRDEISIILKEVKGVYIFYHLNKPVYVGKTDNLKRRLCCSSF